MTAIKLRQALKDGKKIQFRYPKEPVRWYDIMGHQRIKIEEGYYPESFMPYFRVVEKTNKREIK